MYYVGIDLGGTGAQAGIVDESGKIIAKSSIPTKQLSGYQAIVKALVGLTMSVIFDAGMTLDEIKSIGIGCPGSIDDKTGTVYYSNNLVMENAPFCDEMKKYIDKPVYIGNDANCAALGEYFNLNDDSVKDFVALTLGTGVGGGVIVGGKLYTGSNGIAGELGHIRLVMDGEPCTCGRDGCWEAYASATALIRETEKAASKNPDSLLAKHISENGGKANGKIPFDCAALGDETAQKVIDNYIRYVGEGIIDIINIFQPSIVAVGGGISNQKDNLIVPLKKYVMKRTYGAGLVPPVDIVAASLGNDAGIVGAAFLGK